MHEPTYRDAFKASWELAWHHKSLWIFGLFAAFWGQLGIMELLAKVVFGASTLHTPSAFVYAVNFFTQYNFVDFARVWHPGLDTWVWTLWLVVIFVGFAVFLAFISTVSQGAIVHSAEKYMEKRKKKFESSSVSWHESRKYFGKLFALNILRKIIEIAFISFAAWGMANALIEPNGSDVALFLFLFVLAALMGMVLSFMLVYSTGYVVIEKKKFVESLHMAWRLFTRHWLVSFEVGFLLMLANLVLVALVLVGLYLLFLPSLVMWLIAFAIQSQGLYIAGMFLGFGLFLVYLAILGSMFTVFVTSTWSYLFAKMHREGVVSRVVHFFKR
ncbi:MAG: hypothetical protein WCW16_02550 [Candidatus Magasanikbacteria bacterium]